MSMMVSFVLSFFPRDVLDEILNLIESVSEDFPSYSSRFAVNDILQQKHDMKVSMTLCTYDILHRKLEYASWDVKKVIFWKIM